MKKELLIHWTTDNLDTSMSMVLLYAYNAKKKGLWDEITLLVWGASQKLVLNNNEIQEKLKDINDVGVRIIACEQCAKNLNTTDALNSCSIEVFATGMFLTTWLQSAKPILNV